MRLQNLITLSLGWLTACVALAQSPSRDADRVVVVRNENSPVSRAVADDYAQRRSIQHVVCVRCQDSAANPERETIAFAAFQESLEKPLREFLSNHPSLDFIVLTKNYSRRWHLPASSGIATLTAGRWRRASMRPRASWVGRISSSATRCVARTSRQSVRSNAWISFTLTLRQVYGPGTCGTIE